jgi:hypothetical protein
MHIKFARVDGAVFELLANAVKLFAGIRIRAISISLYFGREFMSRHEVSQYRNDGARN